MALNKDLKMKDPSHHGLEPVIEKTINETFVIPHIVTNTTECVHEESLKVGLSLLIVLKILQPSA